MGTKIAIIAAVLGLAAFALWHPARAPMSHSGAAISAPADGPSDRGTPRRLRVRPGAGGDDELVVYVAGAIRKPGLYHLRPGDRGAQAVALAGGLTAAADAAGVNLAQRAQDGDEIYVPAAGELRHARSSARRSRRHAALPADASIDVNHSGATTLAAVPGIGRSIAERIIELRERTGPFASLDELLDVAGMNQSRLDRARPYLRQP